ncbi:MAG: hypothetical protein IPH98_08415 [Saprospiraceae bacterium]|nr:hypothetical protein [Candidatus Defluviibacterium haderslevense]
MMNKMVYTFTFLALITTLLGCKNSNDYRIVKDKYILALSGQRLSIIENSGFKPEAQSILPLLDTIIKQIEKDGAVANEVKNSIYSNLTKWKNDKMYGPPELCDFLILKKDKFKSGKLSTIETFDYIEKYFLFIYWVNWSCNDSFHEVTSLVKLDTLYLRSNSEYELQLQMQYNEIPSIRILSNTIQGIKPNRIKFNTGMYSRNLQKITFQVKAINDINKQIYTFEDTINYLTIKND